MNAAVVATDEYGEVVQRWAYDPWGGDRHPDWLDEFYSTPPTGFPGYDGLIRGLEAEFGLTGMGQRMYDPTFTQLLSPDPVIVPGVTADLNPYSFAWNNPLRFHDRSGRQEGPRDNDPPALGVTVYLDPYGRDGAVALLGGSRHVSTPGFSPDGSRLMGPYGLPMNFWRPAPPEEPESVQDGISRTRASRGGALGQLRRNMALSWRANFDAGSIGGGRSAFLASIGDMFVPNEQPPLQPGAMQEWGAGIEVTVSTVLGPLGGTAGINPEYTSVDGFDVWGILPDYETTFHQAQEAPMLFNMPAMGFSLGGSVRITGAATPNQGESYAGVFESIDGSLGLGTVGLFVSPPTLGGWRGIGVGVGAGAPAGLSYSRTRYHSLRSWLSE